MPFWRTPLFALGLLIAIALIALTAPFAFFRARPWRLARWSSAAASLVGLGFLVLVGLRLFGDVRDFLYSIPTSFRLVLALPFLVGALGLVALGGTVVGWREARWLARIHQVLLLGGTAAVLWFAAEWNLIGW
jgi:hypothetical protein